MKASLPRFKALWWIYLSVMMLFHLLGTAAIAEASISDFIQFTFGSIGFIGLVGYVLQRPFVGRVFWVVYFASSIAVLGWSILSVPSPAVLLDFPVLVGLIVGVPTYWAHFAYAFRSGHLWVQLWQRAG